MDTAIEIQKLDMAVRREGLAPFMGFSANLPLATVPPPVQNVALVTVAPAFAKIIEKQESSELAKTERRKAKERRREKIRMAVEDSMAIFRRD